MIAWTMLSDTFCNPTEIGEGCRLLLCWEGRAPSPLAFCRPQQSSPQRMYRPAHATSEHPATILYNLRDLCTSLWPGAVDLLSSRVSRAVKSWKKPLHSQFSRMRNCAMKGAHSVSAPDRELIQSCQEASEGRPCESV